MESLGTMLLFHVPGNHEYYDGMPFSRGGEILRKHAYSYRLAGHPLYVLDNDAAVVGGVRIIGTTLWTDMDLHNNADEMKARAKHLMNDYRKIFWDVGKSLTPEHTIQRHKESATYLEKMLAENFNGKTIVVTHYLPSETAYFPDYRLPYDSSQSLVV